MCSKKGPEDDCKGVRQSMISICPNEWYTKWDEEREEGTFGESTHYFSDSILHESDILRLLFSQLVSNLKATLELSLNTKQLIK